MSDFFVERFHLANRFWYIRLSLGIFVLSLALLIIAIIRMPHPEALLSGPAVVILTLFFTPLLIILLRAYKFYWELTPSDITRRPVLRHRAIQWSDIVELRFVSRFDAIITTTDNAKINVPLTIFDRRERFLELLITFVPHSRIHCASPLSAGNLEKRRRMISCLSAFLGILGGIGSVWFLLADYRIATFIGMALGSLFAVTHVFFCKKIDNPRLTSSLLVAVSANGIIFALRSLELQFETVPFLHLSLALSSGVLLALGSVLFLMRRIWYSSLAERNRWPERINMLLRKTLNDEKAGAN